VGCELREERWRKATFQQKGRHVCVEHDPHWRSGDAGRAVGTQPGEELIEFLLRLEHTGGGKARTVTNGFGVTEQFVEVNPVVVLRTG
jgi:hypothetical protein